MNIIEHKKELRKQMLVERAQLNASFKSKYDFWICSELENIILDNNYKKVHAYLPMGKEIDILPLIDTLLQKNITIICPKTLPKRKLENRILTSLKDIEQGVFGTTHPANPNEYKGEIDLIIVPGLAFDENNYRLGYGGGYYDNFLAQHPKSKKIGIFYPFQKVEKVPTENHDLALDQILVNFEI